jgi:hypothetical protein
VFFKVESPQKWWLNRQNGKRVKDCRKTAPWPNMVNDFGAQQAFPRRPLSFSYQHGEPPFLG